MRINIVTACRDITEADIVFGIEAGNIGHIPGSRKRIRVSVQIGSSPFDHVGGATETIGISFVIGYTEKRICIVGIIKEIKSNHLHARAIGEDGLTIPIEGELETKKWCSDIINIRLPIVGGYIECIVDTGRESCTR